MPGVEAGAGVQVLAAEILGEGGEPLVEPSLAPPLTRHQVTKPLKRNKWQIDLDLLKEGEMIETWNITV